MRIHDVELHDLLSLEPHGPDTYVGIAAEYPWGPRLYGGQVIAQGLRAACATVDMSRPAHSLHAYFIRPGTPAEPIRYEVERLRDGRSFSTRQVVARQSAGAILNLSVSFHHEEPEANVQIDTMPADVPSPDDPSLPDHGWGHLLDRRGTNTASPGSYWIRLLADIEQDRVLQACALAFMSDAAPTRSARLAHPESTGTPEDRSTFRSASLDHALWFHRPSDASDWHWFRSRSHGLNGARGVVTGEVFTRDGTHVATLAQEILLRHHP